MRVSYKQGKIIAVFLMRNDHESEGNKRLEKRGQEGGKKRNLGSMGECPKDFKPEISDAHLKMLHV